METTGVGEVSVIVFTTRRREIVIPAKAGIDEHRYIRPSKSRVHDSGLRRNDGKGHEDLLIARAAPAALPCPDRAASRASSASARSGSRTGKWREGIPII